ncbi:MAG TPA: sugar ABC transporter permease, partial [Chloroflexota bacterium]
FSMAMIIQSGIRGREFFLYAWTIPLAISDLAAGLVWLSIFKQNGYLNTVLVNTHLAGGGFDFLSYEHPVSMFFAVVIAEVWRSSSLVMLILLGGMQGIPKEYGEAADVFGASFRQRIMYVTLPLLKPSIRVALILRTIFAFQVFAVVIALTGQNLPVLGAQVYYWYNTYQNPHVAASLAVVILGLSVASTVIYLGLLRSRAEVVGGAR